MNSFNTGKFIVDDLKNTSNMNSVEEVLSKEVHTDNENKVDCGEHLVSDRGNLNRPSQLEITKE